MAHPPEKRAALRAAYIGGLPLERAAEKASIPYDTARRWFNAARDTGDDWDKFKAASMVVSGGGIEQALGRIIAAGLMRCEALLEATANAEDPMEGVKAVATLGDTIAKLKSAGKSFMPESDRTAIELDVLKRLAEHAIAQTPAYMAALATVLSSFDKTEKMNMFGLVDDLSTRSKLVPQAGVAAKGGEAGLSDVAASQIRKKVLGVRK